MNTAIIKVVAWIAFNLLLLAFIIWSWSLYWPASWWPLEPYWVGLLHGWILSSMIRTNWRVWVPPGRRRVTGKSISA